MARAALFHGAGRPLELADFPLPRLGDGEVLVRVRCCTLCRSDLHTHAGRRNEPTPCVLGHEIVGEIEEFGPSAPRVDAQGFALASGDRVSWTVAVGCGQCFFCADGLSQKCERLRKYGHMRATTERPFGGGLADHVVLVENTPMFRVPDEVSDAVAAPANCATATVAALFRCAGPVVGRSVLVLGAGVLGVTACAMARAGGAASVVASDANPTCLDRAVAFGASHVCSSDPVELAACVQAVTRGRGADVVLELAGVAATVEASLALARTGGTVVLAGTVAPVGDVKFDPESIVRRLLQIRGMHNYHPQDLATALSFLAGPGRAYPFESLIAGEYRLADAENALAFAHAQPGVRVAVRP